jgi:hypothetical protein
MKLRAPKGEGALAVEELDGFTKGLIPLVGRFALDVHTIRYEDVVEDFDGHVSALCEFLGVPWEEGLRQFSARALDRGKINTPSYEQVSKPIYREARYRWERYRKHLEPFLPMLRPYILQFGYDDPLPAS